MEEIDRLKVKRKPLRRLFTLALAKCEMLLSSDNYNKTELDTAISSLHDKLRRMEEIDSQVSDRLCSLDVNTFENLEHLIDAEVEGCEAYREQWMSIESRYNSIINVRPIVATAQIPDRNYKLPKIQIKPFDGNIRNWIGFWGQFRKIHEDNTIVDDDKFQYLYQATEDGSSARDILDSFPPSGCNYAKAINVLKARFAREELLVEVYVRDLLGLVLDRANRTHNISLCHLYDKITTQLQALETLGVTSEKYAAILFPLVESALPDNTLKAWERYRIGISVVEEVARVDEAGSQGSRSINYLTMILDFLRKEVESEERLSLARSGFAVPYGSINKEKRVQTNVKSNIPTAAAILANSKDVKDICLFCKRPSHNTYECREVADWTYERKREQLKQNGGCFICLKPHLAKVCKSLVKCHICKQRHNTLLCPHTKPDIPPNSKVPPNSKEAKEVSLLSQWTSQTYLQTLTVHVMFGGKIKPVRALLDSGSQRSYISKSCVDSMKLRKVGDEVAVHGLFGGVLTNSVKHGVFEVTLKNIQNQFEIKASLLDQDTICNFIPRLEDKHILERLKKRGIVLSDAKKGDLNIELLIGVDILSVILTSNVEQVTDSLIAVETKLGWTIMGQHSKVDGKMGSISCMNLSTLDISQLWRLDVIGISDPIEVVTKREIEQDILNHFKRTVCRDKDGRYSVQLPWLQGHPLLLNNKNLCLKRLLSTTKNLIRKNMFRDYENIFSEWESLGIIERADESAKISHFIPHHPVVKETSLTTKIRPVFDASAKDKNGNCLNDCLHKGCNFVELIPSILMRFRLRKIGVSADIAKAFLQIGIQENDRNKLKFLWWDDYSLKKLRIYRHCRVVFGITSSPFLLGAVIQELLSKAQIHLCDTAETLKDSFYVDNCLTSVNDSEELNKFMDEAKQLLMSGKFDLRGWVYNGMTEEKPVPVLGLLWDVKRDVLSCIVQPVSLADKPITKRLLLSCAQKLFDPIGFTCPVSLIPKLLLREACIKKIGWDTPLPSELVKEFTSWINHIHLINECRIPRQLAFTNSPLSSNNISLHVFSDASKNAYGCCIFIREELDSNISIRLLAAKSRIAPKEATIPRLELIGATIASRLYVEVKRALKLLRTRVIFWTDSIVALTWIKRPDSWSTFVANRCREIRQNSSIDDWYHIPGEYNAADLPSRGCNARSLLASKWWEGPEWLRLPEEEWPKATYEVPENEVGLERRKTIVSAVNNEELRFSDNFNYSNYNKILRVLGWTLRFLNNVSTGNRKKGELTCEELQQAEKNLLKLVQKEWLICVQEDNSLKSLETYEDQMGIVRIKSRLICGDFEEEFKCPILLPSGHHIVHRLIYQKHLENCHVGVQILLGILRENYWIVRGRKTIQSVISKCIKCKRHQVKPFTVSFPPLPKDRITTGNVFEVSGVDLTGPLFLKGGEKAWIVLFTCAVYRAVHFELIQSLTTDAFLQSLRRFIARRGRITTLYSDNGTNFTGASRVFKKLDWNEIIRDSTIKKIHWKFMPPSAAWWGGWWERLIGMLKRLLRRNLGKSSLSYEELTTVLCDCEAVINSRPLTYLSEDVQDLIPLSPSSFINQTSIHSEVPDFDQIDHSSLTRRVRYLQKLREAVRERFRKEYLGQLRCSSNYQNSGIKVGDVVLIGAENIKRVYWQLGLVIETFPGRDNMTRVVKLRTTSGEVIRPVQKLYPLEISSTNVEETKEPGYSEEAD